MIDLRSTDGTIVKPGDLIKISRFDGGRRQFIGLFIRHEYRWPVSSPDVTTITFWDGHGLDDLSFYTNDPDPIYRLDVISL